MANPAVDFSSDLAAAVAAAAPSVVRVVRGDRGPDRSGLVWNDRGLIVTSGRRLGRDIAVVAADGDERKAELVGRDRGTDVALLRVDPDGLAPLAFRETDDLAVGHAALAIARPGRSVRASLRIIGVLGTEVDTPMGGRLEHYIETDRAIPPGFAGGPLVDIAGKAIGMNTRGVFRGADLAVSHATLSRVVGELETHGTVPRGFLGVATRPVKLPEPVARSRGEQVGALVIDVVDGSAASGAGIVLGDVLLAIDGARVRGARDLYRLLGDKAGSTVGLDLLRAGAETSVEVEVGTRSAS